MVNAGNIEELTTKIVEAKLNQIPDDAIRGFLEDVFQNEQYDLIGDWYTKDYLAKIRSAVKEWKSQE